MRSWSRGLMLALVALALGCSDPELAPDGGPGPCAIDCDCPQGQACIDATCTATASPIYCCDNAGCPQGDRCVTRGGTLDRCPECVVDCDCDQGLACVDGACTNTGEPSFCCDNPGCPPGQACTDLRGASATCELECESHCDCEQGEACSASGVCVATAEPTWCCENSGCPLGEACTDRDGAGGTCAECEGPCDCPQGQACSSSGLCVETLEPTWCCEQAGCPSGEACVEPSGAESVCGMSGLDAGVGRDAGSWTRDAGVDAGSAATCAALDIVFVIDDSASMAEEQQELIDRMPGFLTALDGLQWRLGVTTTTVSGSFSPFLPGELVQPEGCGMTRPWVEAGDTGILDVVDCIGAVGTGGSGYEMPLRATELAITDRVSDGSNAAFFRAGTPLAVFILSDEDDCSSDGDPLLGCEDLIMPSRVRTALDTFRPDRWTASVVAGDAAEGCSSALGEAAEAVRLMDFLAGVDHGVFSSICSGNLSVPMRRSATAFIDACEAAP